MTEQQRAIASAIREEVRFATECDPSNDAAKVLADVSVEIALAILRLPEPFDKDRFLSECGLEWDVDRGKWVAITKDGGGQ